MKYLFRIYQWCIAAPIMVVVTIVIATITALGCLVNRSWFGFYPPKLWGKCFCWLFFVKVKVVGQEKIDKHTSYMFVANHQGAYDIFTVFGYLKHNFRWMMRKGLINIPFIGQACQLSGHVLVDTKSTEALRKTMADAHKRLEEGISLVVFPEGRRTNTGKMGPFKNGGFKLAVEYNLPVVPITIDGSYRVMPRSTFNITPGTIILTIHEPIVPGPEGHDIRQLAQESCRIIKSALPEEQE